MLYYYQYYPTVTKYMIVCVCVCVSYYSMYLTEMAIYSREGGKMRNV